MKNMIINMFRVLESEVTKNQFFRIFIPSPRTHMLLMLHGGFLIQTADVVVAAGGQSMPDLHNLGSKDQRLGF